MKLIHMLILEDDLETVSKLFGMLAGLENELYQRNVIVEFSVISLSEYTDVENLINNLKADKFDIILLDRDCKAAGSFHILDIEKFGADKVISISSTPSYNEDAINRGVKRVVHKTYNDLDAFTSNVMAHIREML